MERVYNRINWENEPSILTPLNATNLNKIDSAVYTIDGRVVGFDTTKAEQSDLLQCVKSINYNTTTGTFTFTWQNGTVQTVDLNIEKIPVSFTMDEHGVITMTTADGTQYTADVGALIKTYTFNDSSVIDFTVTTDASGNKIVTANIIDGTIDGTKLVPNYLADCLSAKDGAETAEDNAEIERLKSEGFAVGEQDGVPVTSGSPYYHNNAKYYSEQANVTSLVSLTDVDINNPQDKQALVYDSVSGKWINGQGGSVIDELNDIGDVNITNPSDRQALVYNNGEWVNGSGGLLPRMVIQTEVGSTVTITNGSESITAEAQGMGIYFAEIPDFDDWTVTATNGGQTSTQTVTVDTVKIYSVNASYFTAYINVTAPSGSSVTVANGTETYTQTSGYNFTVHSSGTWNITVTKTDATKSGSVSITTDGQTATATFEFASINVTYASEFSGATISATDGTHTYTRVASGTVSFDIADFGTWTISATVSGSTFSTSVEVTEYTSYSAELTMYGYQGWLNAGGITKTFSSLAEVLADEPTVRTLMNKHDSVDYLVLWLPIDASSLTTIINDNYCAKWINLRDYALDTLYANQTIASAMDTADKYFYGEWVERDGVWQPKGNVPIMTSDSAPYGQAFSSGVDLNNPSCLAYKAFDNDENTYYWSSARNNAYVGYKFVNPICAKIISVSALNSNAIRLKNFKVQGSNDGTTYTDLYTGVYAENDSIQTFKLNNSNYYLYYRLFIIDNYGHEQQTDVIKTLQFYGRELKVSVPTMTSNTSPWGEAIKIDEQTSYEAYKAFNSTIQNGWLPLNGTSTGFKVGDYVGYDFGGSVNLKFLNVEIPRQQGAYANNITLSIQGFDGSAWNTIGSVSLASLNVWYSALIQSDNGYSKYRVKFDSISNTASGDGIKFLFYGLDYSEHEERRYLYDRGVELETITSGKATIDTTNYNLLRAEDTYHATTSDRLACGSANALVNGLPNNNYLDISNVNGNNATGWTTVGNIVDTSFWVE